MFTHPLVLAPLAGLVFTLAWAGLRPGPWPLALALACVAALLPMLARRFDVERRALTERLDAAELRAAEQQQALQATEAARTQLQERLRASEQRFVLAVRGSQDGLWEWDIERGQVLLSPRWKSMLGFEEGELPDDRAAWLSRVHPQDREPLLKALARHLASPDSRFDHELRLLHKDGGVRWVLSRGVAIRHASGAAYRMVGMDSDVTRLKRIQAVLDAVAEGTAGAYGERFFPALAEHFARALEVSCAFITECADQPPSRLRTLAFWSSEEGLKNNFEYALPGTPCEAVVTGGRTCFHPSGVGRLFPAEAGFEAYLGLPIIASDGRVLGHLAFLHTAPLGQDMLIESIYRIFLARAAAELERRDAVERLQALAREAAVPS
jgi:PAS domain S-box-containing protein